MFIVIGLVLALAGLITAMVLPLNGFSKATGASITPNANEHQIESSRWIIIGIVLSALISITIANLDFLGRGTLLAFPIFGCLTAVTVSLIEALRPQKSSEVRSASIKRRRLSSYLNTAFGKIVATGTILLFTLALVATLTGSADDMGRAGRFFRVTSGEISKASGPWPGSFYSIPLLIAMLIGIVVAVVSLSLVVTRNYDRDNPEQDEALRKQSADSIIGAYGLMIATPLIGYALTMLIVLPESEFLSDAANISKYLLLVPILFGTLLFGWSAKSLLHHLLLSIKSRKSS